MILSKQLWTSWTLGPDLFIYWSIRYSYLLLLSVWEKKDNGEIRGEDNGDEKEKVERGKEE